MWLERHTHCARTALKWIATLSALALAGCQPSAEEQARRQERMKAEEARQQELCRDSTSCGELRKIDFDHVKYALRKWNNRWFLVPREYDSHYGMSFRWPSNAPRGRDSIKHDPHGWVIQLQIRSHDIPPPPLGYRLIEAAERDSRIVKRETVRLNLDRVEFFSLHPFTGERSRTASVAYVAINRRDPEGLPPVLGCNADPLTREKGGAGAGFMWRDGIFVEVLIREGHVCEDWPELFDEVMRVLDFAKGV